MSTFSIRTGHVLDVLRTLETDSVHCVVTSPPYWGLRSYGHHEVQVAFTYDGTGRLDPDHFPARRGAYPGSQKFRLKWRAAERQGVFCRWHCCWIGTIGLEPTLGQWLANMVAIFREVRRVLRPDGTAWVNMGDSYAHSGASGGGTPSGHPDAGRANAKAAQGQIDRRAGTGLKAKDIVGQPWRLAFALQDDGWYLRGENIWAKPNPMPESVLDRPTRAHEYVFQLSPSARYFYDRDAVRTPYTEASLKRIEQPTFWEQEGGEKDYGRTGTNPNRSARQTLENVAKRMRDGFRGENDERQGAYVNQGELQSNHEVTRKPAGWNDGPTEDDKVGRYSEQPKKAKRQRGHARPHQGFDEDWGHRSKLEQSIFGANLRSVWWIAIQPFAGAHFATFPTKIPETCILASTSAHGVCAECGAQWERVTAPTAELEAQREERKRTWEPSEGGKEVNTAFSKTPGVRTEANSLGRKPTCGCGADVKPAVVLDPFSGSGTTGLVALRHGRDYVGIELNPDYAEMSRERIRSDAPLWNVEA